jgi:hypothetical protein
MSAGRTRRCTKAWFGMIDPPRDDSLYDMFLGATGGLVDINRCPNSSLPSGNL